MLLVERKEVETGNAIVRILQVLAGVLPAEETRGERAPHRQAYSVLTHHRDDVALDVPAQQRVVHLAVREARKSIGPLEFQRRRGFPGRPVREAEIANLARAHE